MKYLKQFSILCAFCFAGDLLSVPLGGKIPGNVLGIALLLVFLCMKWVRESQFQEVGTFLQQNMAFFFLPASLGILEVLPQIGSKFGILLLISVITTFLTAAAAALTVIFVVRLQNRSKAKKEEAACRKF
ncbi:MAG: CidA/LrgA family protein [Butyricicoccaceae bacterium]